MSSCAISCAFWIVKFLQWTTCHSEPQEVSAEWDAKSGSRKARSPGLLTKTRVLAIRSGGQESVIVYGM